MHFYSESKLGSKRSTTREGFLICHDVKLARTGSMVYGRGEIPVSSGPDGLIRITRDADEVFRNETLASYNSKPITEDHPAELVTADNWHEYAHGHVTNVRQGTGLDADYMLGDIVVQRKAMIDKINSGKVEISCGYTADYQQLALGHGRQHNILGNHIAFVAKGRCGSTCAVGDAAIGSTSDKAIPEKGPAAMTTLTWNDRMRDAISKKDFPTMDLMMGELAGTGVPPGRSDTLPSPADDPVSNPSAHRIIVNVHGGGQAPGTAGTAIAPGVPTLNPGGGPQPAPSVVSPGAAPTDPNSGMMLILQQILQELRGTDTDNDDDSDPNLNENDEGGADQGTKPFGAGTKDAAIKKEAVKTDNKVAKGKKEVITNDSAELSERFQDVHARAEILYPGVQGITFDAKAEPTMTLDAICTLQRRALKGAYSSDEGKQLVSPFVGKEPNFSTMTCDAVNIVFMGASELTKALNNTRVAGNGKMTHDSKEKAPVTIKSIQERNEKFWKQENGRIA